MSEKEQMLLAITIDSNFSLEEHINNLYKKASQKLKTLARIATLYGHRKTKNYNETIYYISAQLLSISMDVSQQKPK